MALKKVIFWTENKLKKKHQNGCIWGSMLGQII